MPPNMAGQAHVRIRSPPRLHSPPRMLSLPRIIDQPILALAPVPRRGPNQCSKCKKPKVEPSHRQYFGNWKPQEKATTTGPKGCASGDIPAGKADRPRQMKRTQQLIPLQPKTKKKKPQKFTYTVIQPERNPQNTKILKKKNQKNPTKNF